jgi:hypothetical protein
MTFDEKTIQAVWEKGAVVPASILTYGERAHAEHGSKEKPTATEILFMDGK